jgi:hypothetical protein
MMDADDTSTMYTLFNQSTPIPGADLDVIRSMSNPNGSLSDYNGIGNAVGRYRTSINGYPAIEMSNADNWGIAIAFTDITPAYTAYLVVSNVSTATTGTPVLTGYGNDVGFGARDGIGTGSTNNLTIGFRDDLTNFTGIETYTGSEKMLITARTYYTGTTSGYSKNGGTEVTDSSTLGNLESVDMGKGTSGPVTRMYVHEHLLYDGAHTTTQRDTVNTYLADKWGITLG